MMSTSSNSSHAQKKDKKDPHPPNRAEMRVLFPVKQPLPMATRPRLHRLFHHPTPVSSKSPYRPRLRRRCYRPQTSPSAARVAPHFSTHRSCRRRVLLETVAIRSLIPTTAEDFPGSTRSKQRQRRCRVRGSHQEDWVTRRTGGAAGGGAVQGGALDAAGRPARTRATAVQAGQYRRIPA